MREPHYGPLVQVSVLSCPEVFFVLRGCIARQGSTDAYGGYDKLLHGFLGKHFISAGIVHTRAGRLSRR
jgi:hypothetical protein